MSEKQVEEKVKELFKEETDGAFAEVTMSTCKYVLLAANQEETEELKNKYLSAFTKLAGNTKKSVAITILARLAQEKDYMKYANTIANIM